MREALANLTAAPRSIRNPLAIVCHFDHNKKMACAKNIFIAAACTIIVALPGITFAQQLMPGLSLHPDKPPLTPEEQERRKAVDDAYKSAIKKLPDKKKLADDSWGNIRSTTTT
ncbi:MAG: hypothetical protein WA322_04185 [Pseudolabrys sp.]